MADDAGRELIHVYVPSHQKGNWNEHADELGMSRSEFVKAMVQAGRRGFGADPEEPDSTDETPMDDGLESRVLDVLDDGYRSWDDLVAALTEDIETRLETTLRRLQHENRVQYSGSRGGYASVDTDDD